MKTTHALLAALVLGVLIASPVLAEDLWTENAKEALARAAKEGKDLLINATGSDWCGWCKRLDREVFSQADFVAEAPKHFVFLKLDYPRRRKLSDEIKKQNAEWRKKLPIRGFPTILLTDATGKPYATTGYRRGGPKPYLESLATLRKKHTEYDEAMAEAQKAEGVEKAKLLDKAIATIAPALIARYYADVVEEILKLDADGKAGLKNKFAAMAILEKANQARGRREHDEAIKLVDEGLALVGQKGKMAQNLLFAKSLAYYSKKDKENAQKFLEAALEAEPEGQKATQIKGILKRFFKVEK